MRAGRWSPDRLSLAATRAGGPLGAVAAGLLWGASRTAAPSGRVAAALKYDGDRDAGAAQGETRTLQGLTVTNYGAVPLGVEVEEMGGPAFSATVQPGQTIDVTGLALTQYWNTVGPAGFAGRWDGLNVRWKEPA